MATFTIDLLSGNQYLFSGNFTNSGTTTFTGLTSANNGLTRVGVGGHTVKLGGTLTCVTTIVQGGGNTAGIEYGGDYSAGFTARSLVDKGYTDTKVPTTLFNSFTGTTLPANYYNKTQINSYSAQTLTNINSRLLISIFTGYTATTAPNTYLTKIAFNSFTGTTLPANYYNKTQINSYTGQTLTLINTKLGIKRTVVTGATYTPTNNDVIIGILGTTGGTVNINLPNISTINNNIFWIFKDEGFNAGTNNIIFSAFTGNYIEKEITVTLTVDGSSITLYNDNSLNWYVI